MEFGEGDVLKLLRLYVLQNWEFELSDIWSLGGV